jgi:hypothetical protein
VGETRVDLLHLLEDLRDAYPGALEETILTEIVANSLDSRATRVDFTTDPAASTLTVADDGRGMARRELRRYHDVAATAKTRGEGIGFAGVGIKLGLLASEEVVTETCRGRTPAATTWHLASRQRAPWRFVPPPGLVAAHGTAVRLRLRNPLSPLLDGGFVEACLERHFEPLLDRGFDECLARTYPAGVAFVVNGRPLARRAGREERAPLAIRLGRRRKPVAVGYLQRAVAPLPEAERGVAVSTLGKVIKRGWDWLGVTPAQPSLVGGLVEVPALAGSLTLNKADFIRTGPRGAVYLGYRKAVQEAVSRQLALWGDVRDTSDEARRRARPIERDLQRMLADLAEEFPLLAALVERQAGGQRRLPAGGPGPLEPSSGELHVAEESEAPAAGVPAEGQESPTERAGEPPAPASERGGPPPAASEPAESGPGPGGRRRPGRYGLGIEFESRPDDPGLGRLVESTVWVNEAHPAYRRAAASRSEGYHLALSVGLALAPLAVEPAQAPAFLATFMARWGAALDRPGARRGRARPRRS